VLVKPLVKSRVALKERKACRWRCTLRRRRRCTPLESLLSVQGIVVQNRGGWKTVLPAALASVKLVVPAPETM